MQEKKEKKQQEKKMYIAEVHDVAWEEQPHKGNDPNEIPLQQNNGTLKYKHWEDALRFFFDMRVVRDFCYGDNFIDQGDRILRFECDEIGETTIILHKWDTFAEDTGMGFEIEDKVFDGPEAYNDLYAYLTDRFKDPYVYWKDDTAGTIGHVHNITGGEDKNTGIVVRRHFNLKRTPYLEEIETHSAPGATPPPSHYRQEVEDKREFFSLIADTLKSNPEMMAAAKKAFPSWVDTAADNGDDELPF